MIKFGETENNLEVTFSRELEFSTQIKIKSQDLDNQPIFLISLYTLHTKHRRYPSRPFF